MSDILLLYPKTGNDIKPAIAPPHSLLAIAALPNKAGYNVRIIDQRICHNWKEELLKELKTKPLLVGISTMTGTQIHFAIELAKVIREHSDTPIVWGGKHPTLLPEQTLINGYADIVCIGEGDYTLKEIADCLSSEKTLNNIKGIFPGSSNSRTEQRPLADMNELPTPAWNLINAEDYIHPDMYIRGNRTMDLGQTSRGCPFSCGFCSQGNSKWRAMTAEKSIAMIKELVDRYRLDGIWLRDDEFYISSKRAAEICEGITHLNIKWYTSGTRIDLFNKTSDEQLKLYKRSGADVLKFGAESGSDRVLEMIGKKITREDTIKANLRCKEFGITPAYNLMAGFPSETLEEIEETISLIKRLKKDNPNALFETVSLYAPMPGTPMWNTAMDYGLKPPEALEGWTNWRFDEYDDRGERIPWYSKKERRIIGNICYLLTLVNTVPNMANSYNGNRWSKFAKTAYKIPHSYFNFRLSHNLYKFMPELQLIQELRKRIFYK